MADFQGATNDSSAPPALKSYRGPGCGGCCSGFRCCCVYIFNCIFSLVLQLLAIIVLIAAIVVLFFWFVRPHVMKFHVTDTILTQFTYVNNTLHYNLALNITVRNPNKRIGIYYDFIETTASYQDVRFGYQMLGTFFQHHKNTSVLSPIFEGQQVMPLDKYQNSEMNEDNNLGVYDINVRLHLKVRFKLGLIKSWKIKLKEVRCDLKVPLESSHGTSSGIAFQATECYWDYRWLRIH